MKLIACISFSISTCQELFITFCIIVLTINGDNIHWCFELVLNLILFIKSLKRDFTNLMNFKKNENYKKRNQFFIIYLKIFNDEILFII